jgi:hypothetical protein
MCHVLQKYIKETVDPGRKGKPEAGRIARFATGWQNGY